MAVTPRTRRTGPRAKSGDKTLSAAQLLKAAESAIGENPRSVPAKAAAPATPAAKPAAQKPAASRKSVTRPANLASDAAPAVVAAAVMAVDAAPEPSSEGAETFGKPKRASSTARVKTTPKPLPVTEGTTTMNDIIENGKKFAEEAKAKIETAYADFNEKAKAGVEKSTKALEEFSDLAKGNVEALVESGKIAAKGVETLGQEAVDYGRKNFEKATASFKSFSTVKTPTEFFQLQSQLFATSFDDFAKEAAKSSEALLKLAGDVAQPLAARVSVVTDKVKTLAR
ncbi:MAG: phasin family protein [Sphingobium sp.]